MNPAPGRGLRLAAVLSHPTQYYSPWFRWVRAHTSIELRVFYLWDFGVVPSRDPNFGARVQWDVDLLSGYDSVFVPNRARRPGAEHFRGFVNPGLPSQLGAWRPEALLLFGYKWATHLRAIAWARYRRLPILFRGDSHLLGRPAPRLPVRLALRLLFSQFASFLYVGAANREYFEAFGATASRLFFAPHSVDASLFDRRNPHHRAAAERLRAELGLGPGTKVVLFAGKLVAAKQPAELLAAFLALRRPDSALVFVGDGPEKGRLQAAAAGHSTGPRVRFLPFANQSEMPARYLLADVFALPSRGVYETWGLAVNEAMHMGVPCLVSNRVGCQRDLVEPGETGWVFEVERPGALAAALAGALDDAGAPPRIERIRAAVEPRIVAKTYQNTKDGLQAALAGAARPGPPPTRLKITIVTGFFLPVPAVAGGATEKTWYGLAGLFAAAGHAVTFVSRRRAGLANDETARGVRHLRLPGFDHSRFLALNLACDFWWGLRVARALPSADLLICNTVTLPAWLPRVRPGAGRVAVMIGRVPKGQVRLYGKVDRIYAPSSFVAGRMPPGWASERTRVIGYPIDWSLQARSAAQAPPPVTLGYVGRLHPEKGLALLVRAAGRLAARSDLPPWRLRIAGPVSVSEGGGGEDWIEALRREAAGTLGGRIEWLPPEFDAGRLALLYGSLDVFCYPSLAAKGETFGVAVAEAMAARCAVVVSGLACFSDLVTDDETGLVFAQDGPDAVRLLADRLALLIADATTRDRLARRGQEHARRFDFPEVARAVLNDLALLAGATPENPPGSPHA